MTNSQAILTTLRFLLLVLFIAAAFKLTFFFFNPTSGYEQFLLGLTVALVAGGVFNTLRKVSAKKKSRDGL